MALDRRVRPLNLIDLVLPLFLTGAKVPGGVIVDLGASVDEYQPCDCKHHRHAMKSHILIAARSARESTTVVCTTFGTSLAQNSCRSFGGRGEGAMYTELSAVPSAIKLHHSHTFDLHIPKGQSREADGALITQSAM